MLRHSLPRLQPTLVPSSSTHIPRRTIVSLLTRHPLLHSRFRPRRAPVDSQDHNTTPRPAHYPIAKFHSTPRQQAAPIIPLFAILKASTALELARTAGRIAFTFIPLILLKNLKSRKILQKVDHAEKNNIEIPWVKDPKFKRETLLKRMRNRALLFHALMFAPFALFWGAILASLERTPLTGRWRLILLSPAEEDEISSQLAGSGWYHAIGEILAKDGPLTVVPPSDWRHAWVTDTLRRLEAVIPLLGDERNLEPQWLERGPDDIPLPPPADYPLRPRPRASEALHSFCEMWSARGPSTQNIPGPPYSLVLVDNPESNNAFSYGFGPDGAGGVVVFSGFINQILEKYPLEQVILEQPKPWWSALFGSLFSTQPSVVEYRPTPEQTSDLAILLAHELAHLVLSHHLEALSSRTIVIPGVLSIFSDLLRTLTFPLTMLFGPFVNDAVAQIGKVGSGELGIIHENCTTILQEIEADVVSARLLAHAGFDPRRAVQFWEDRCEDTDGDCSINASPHSPEVRKEQKRQKENWSMAMRLTSSDHPMNEVRVTELKTELQRWRDEREKAVARGV